MVVFKKLGLKVPDDNIKLLKSALLDCGLTVKVTWLKL